MAEYTPEGYFSDDWKRRAACREDDRFIQEPNIAVGIELKAICGGCDVLTHCKRWVDEDQVTDVFAAGYWRGSDELPIAN